MCDKKLSKKHARMIRNLLMILYILNALDLGISTELSIYEEKESDASREDKNNQDEKSICIFPLQPKHGKYAIYNSTNSPKPGVRARNGTSIHFTCLEGFILVGYDRLFCVNDVWSSVTSQCVPYCPPLVSASIAYNCFYDGLKMFCDDNLPSGAVAYLSCRNSYVAEGITKDKIICRNNSTWTHSKLKCQPECGTIKNFDISNIRTVPEENIPRFPWHVTVCRKTPSLGIQHICSGTIISSTVVLSASKCYYRNFRAIDPKQLEVAYCLGFNSSYRDITKTYKVKQLLLYSRMHFVSIRENIAIIKVATIFQFSDVVRPICMNWGPNEIMDNVLDRSIALMASWNQLNNTSPRILQVRKLAMLSGADCKMLKGKIPGFLDNEILCGNKINGPDNFKMDQGGGLVFLSNHHDKPKLYLGGIFISQTDFTFTNISTYSNWFNSQNLSVEPEVYSCSEQEIITMGSVCDDEPDCTDDYDENQCSHRRVRIEAGGCTLPKQPLNGKYSIKGSRTLPSNPATVNGTVLIYKCDPNYTPTADENPTCMSGQWSIPPVECLRTCKPLRSDVFDYECYFKGTMKNCRTPMFIGANAHISCKKTYVLGINELEFDQIKCQEDGTWEKSKITCRTECGTISTSIQNRASFGFTVNTGNLPWVAGIYLRKKQICGGSLVNTNIVITAAHCFIDKNEELYDVGLGKMYRKWNAAEDMFAVYSGVRKIIINPDYHGSNQLYSSDIAILQLTKLIEFNELIRPVCVDWDNNVFPKEISPDSIGRVAGWGLNEKGVENEILQEINIPAVTKDKCRENVPKNFVRYITTDKLCAGRTNGSTVCKGDSGSGLCFPDRQHGSNLLYLAGIVSVVHQGLQVCNPHHYVLYTAVSSHIAFLKQHQVQKHVLPFTCDSKQQIDRNFVCDNRNDCADGSDEDDLLCIQRLKQFIDTLSNTNRSSKLIPGPTIVLFLSLIKSHVFSRGLLWK